MDTTLDPSPVWSGKALFYKLQAEAFLQSAGVGFSIVKPCGLADNMPGGTQKLEVGHDDTLMGGKVGGSPPTPHPRTYRATHAWTTTRAAVILLRASVS